MWIVEKMFARAGHFILEFIQNAEATKVKVILQKDVVKILNNGVSFSRDDVEAICSVEDLTKILKNTLVTLM
jgi:hypothetical protein